MESAASVIGRLDRWLAANRPAFYASLRPGLTAKQVDELEACVGYELPGPFRAFYEWRDGQDESGEPFMWNRYFMPADDVQRTWTLFAELLDAGEWDEPQWYCRGWVPFLHNGGGSYLCLDLHGSFTGRSGQVIEFWNRDMDRPVVAPSFFAWLGWYVDSLEAGAWRLDPRSGNFERLRDVRPLPGYPVVGDARAPL